jgi:hypothetical protein
MFKTLILAATATIGITVAHAEVTASRAMPDPVCYSSAAPASGSDAWRAHSCDLMATADAHIVETDGTITTQALTPVARPVIRRHILRWREYSRMEYSDHVAIYLGLYDENGSLKTTKMCNLYRNGSSDC